MNLKWVIDAVSRLTFPTHALTVEYYTQTVTSGSFCTTQGTHIQLHVSQLTNLLHKGLIKQLADVGTALL